MYCAGALGSNAVKLTVVGFSAPFPNTGVPKFIPLAKSVEGGVKFIGIAFAFIPGQFGAFEGVYVFLAQAVGLPAAACYTVRDLWSHTGVPTTGVIARPAIPPHAVVMLRVSASCG